QRRLEWCLAHRDWLVPDWLRVIWTDEAAFRVGDVIGNTWVARRPNEEFNIDRLMPKYKSEPVLLFGVSCWWTYWTACYLGSYLGVLFITGQEALIEPIHFMEDNAPAHRSRVSQAAQTKLGLAPYRLDWPASSPDLNPIEN
ncbi:hypothetical protein BGX38DRAFT_1064901, partial [Terfezia claveryi]